MSEASKYRKKPIVIEAIQYKPGTGGNCDAIEAFLGGTRKDHVDGNCCDSETEWYIPTLEGEMVASAGDWIIRGIQGEFYPCKSDIFAATYERVADNDRDSMPEVRGGEIS